MSKGFLFLVLCVWSLCACNLSVRRPEAAAAPLTANQTGSRAGQELNEVATPSAVTRCYPPAEWPQYTVTAGDTLSGIAVRSNSTAAELAAANCLDDPNLLVAGKSIYVRQLPVAATPASAATDRMELDRNTYVH